MSSYSNDTVGADTSEYVTCGGTVLAGGLLSGCTGSSGSDPSDSETATETAKQQQRSPNRRRRRHGRALPRHRRTSRRSDIRDGALTWVAYDGGYADMGVALGKTDGDGIGGIGRYCTWHYDDVPGRSPSTEDMVSLGRTVFRRNHYSKSTPVFTSFDQLHGESHRNWDRSDVEEMHERVGPFCGNTSSDVLLAEDFRIRWGSFREGSRTVPATGPVPRTLSRHDEFIAEIQRQLPPADERPNVLLVYEGSDEPETFSPYRLNDRHGKQALARPRRQRRTRRERDRRLSRPTEGRSTTKRSSKSIPMCCCCADTQRTRYSVRGHVPLVLQDHDTASQLTAVQNGAVTRLAGCTRDR